MVRQWIAVAWLFTQTDGARIHALVKSATDARPLCLDTDDGLTNTFQNGCSAYGDKFGDTKCGMFDTDSFKSWDMCCSCGGGTGKCQDSDDGLTNTFGNGCSNYGFFGSDGDTPCGFYDEGEFISNDLCCVCGGGRSGPAGPPQRRMVCTDSDNGRTNTWDDGCSKYGSGWDDTSCGMFDNDGFKSKDMCCICEGGERGPEAVCEEHTCAVGQVSTGHRGGCDALSCVDSQCCEPEATCGTMECGSGFIRIHDVNYGCGANLCSIGQCCGGANRIQARITDATNLAAIAHAEVVITQGNLEIRRTTDSNGAFDAEGVPTGEIRMLVNKDGYISAEKTITVTGSISGAVADLFLSPVLPLDGWRAVLTWGASPADLDSHTYLPQGHVSYQNRHASCPGVSANLDVDKTHGYGPETTSLTHVISGKILFKVNNYSRTPGWGGSDAMVKLYNGDREVGTYHVNSHGIQSGFWWSVFYIDGSTGQVFECSTAACL